ncbi:Oxysterol-binding protein 4 [Cladophialophora chaetospira]|uniref:Oxysterol-binding protein 4 n=1 Tax=Cladophialophora chaetospira TaxID=386627 RepID=A0AA38XBF5_9EURO|nr:Oxysterol-binding protein 4 [Cladophialophora chaetospira]
MPEVEGGAVPSQSKGSWSSFLKSIASFNGDLASLTAPAFILSTQSLVEFSAYWAENQSLFIAPSLEKDPAKRALLVLKWLLNTLKQQYCSRSEKLGSEKKPLNPFLGELYLGKWDDQFGETTLVSEQVSHHPPVTAYCITNEKHRVRLQGYNGQKASFSRTIHVKQIGHALLTLHPPGSELAETYLITLPALHIESLIYGAPFVELGKFINIVSSTGYVAKIDFAGKGWLSGTKNSFTATLWKEHEGSEKSPLYAATGQWSDSFVIKEGDAKRGKEVLSFKPSDIKIAKLNVAPIEEQDVLESRRAWSKVSHSIEKGDMDAVAHHKSRIENAQRALRKKEQEEKRDWDRVFFSQADPKDKLEQTFAGLVKITTSLGAGSWEGVAPEKTAGVWRYDENKAAKARKPFHPKEGSLAVGENPDGSSAPISRVTTQQSTR